MSFTRSSRSRVAILSAWMIITATVQIGCSGSPDAVTSDAATVPPAQPSAAATFKPADDAAVTAGLQLHDLAVLRRLRLRIEHI